MRLVQILAVVVTTAVVSVVYAQSEPATRMPRPQELGPGTVAAMIKVIDGLTLENSSQPINFDGSVLPW